MNTIEISLERYNDLLKKEGHLESVRTYLENDTSYYVTRDTVCAIIGMKTANNESANDQEED